MSRRMAAAGAAPRSGRTERARERSAHGARSASAAAARAPGPLPPPQASGDRRRQSGGGGRVVHGAANTHVNSKFRIQAPDGIYQKFLPRRPERNQDHSARWQLSRNRLRIQLAAYGG